MKNDFCKRELKMELTNKEAKNIQFKCKDNKINDKEIFIWFDERKYGEYLLC